LTGGEASDCTQLETSLDIGPDIKPRAAITDKGYDSAANRAACRGRGYHSRDPAPLEFQEQAKLLSEAALQDAGAHRASHGQAEAL
jgi:hypothetical protein